MYFINNFSIAALLRLPMKLSTDLNVNKTIDLFLHNIYISYFIITLIWYQIKHLNNSTLYDT